METELTIPHTWQGETIELALKTARAAGNPQSPGFVWLGGFKSDMTGTKAEAMVTHAQELGHSSLRFDYSGHGASGGEFVKGTISRWVDESLEVVCSQTEGPQILLGSSMGAWIALRLAQRLGEIGEADRLHSLLLIAPAPDFTSKLMEPAFSDEQRALMKSQGYIEEPSEYSDEPNIITRDLIEDGRDNAVMVPGLKLGCPVHILQGMKDPDVPYQHALELVEVLAQDDVTITMVKGGDHRLSRDEDIALLKRTMTSMI